MRLLFPVAIICSAAALAQPAKAPVSPGRQAAIVAGSDCPATAPHLANRGGDWRSPPLKPRKLNELPPADSFAAVVRTDDRGCLVPVKYPPTRGWR